VQRAARSFHGERQAGVIVRGLRPADLAKLTVVAEKLRAGSLAYFDRDDVVIVGSGLAAKLGVQVGGDITLIAPETVTGIEIGEASAAVTLGSGMTLTADLLVAADGQRSALRKMAGFKIVEWTSDQAAITGTIAHEKPHEGRAVQHFLPAGPFALLPMVGNRSSIVWTERADEARRILNSGETEMLTEIERRIGGALGRLSLAGRPLRR